MNVSTIEDAYDEIVKWRKNTFLVPYGKIGREFIDKFTEHINDWNNESPLQHIALKAAIVLLAVGLQKPSQKSKAKDHKECLGKRLDQWNRGEIDFLLREGRAIQRRLISSPCETLSSKQQSHLMTRMSLARSDARVKRKLTVRGVT